MTRALCKVKGIKIAKELNNFFELFMRDIKGANKSYKESIIL